MTQHRITEGVVDGIPVEPGARPAPANIRVEVIANGPYAVRGLATLTQLFIAQDASGASWTYNRGASFDLPDPAHLCRCGASAKKPFCDGTHTRIGFDGTETAPREPLLAGAEVQDGPSVSLSDNDSYCCFARFCDGHGKVWNLVMQEGEQAAQLTRYEANHCPAGRLKAWERDGMKPVEPEFAPSIALLEDPAMKCSAGLWLRGGIRVIAADGQAYEIRNRVALCRCGQSSNKPYCDGSHASAHWQDGLPQAAGEKDF